MSTFRWIIIAGLLGMLTGAVFSDTIYHHKVINGITIHATPEAFQSTVRSPVEVVSLAGITIYERCLIGTNSFDQTTEEYGWNPGRYGKYILPPLLMGAVFTGLVRIILIIRWINALPNQSVNGTSTPARVSTD